MSRAASNTTTAQFGQRFEIAMENRVEDVVNVRQLAVTATVVEVAPKASGDTRRRGLLLYNSGTSDILLCFGDQPATSTRWNWKLKADEAWWAMGLRCKVTAIRSTTNTTLQVGDVL
jgi:hypothetical protein